MERDFWQKITDVINIGGSDMEPRAVYHALRKPIQDIRLHFLASADGTQYERVTAGLVPHNISIFA